MAGLYSGWGPLYALIINTLGKKVAPTPQITASWIGFYSNISGNIGGMVVSILFVVSPILPNVSKYKSEESVHREWSTVVDISITLPSFKPISLSLALDLQELMDHLHLHPIDLQ